MTRVLIADDNQQNLYLLESILKAFRMDVTSVRNGKEALESARDNPPDLVIADILMPVMDGFELCRHWKADSRLSRIPFIFYTATYTDPKDERFALSLGVERFVVKPQKPEVLMGIIREVLEESSKKTPEAPAKPLGEEMEVLRQYNEVLFRKLEKKVLQLEAEIAERKRTEERLVLSEARYRTLYEKMMDGYVSVDMAGKILEYNKAYQEMLGYSGHELDSLTYQDLTPERWHEYEQYIVTTQILPRGYSDVYEKEYRRKDGSVVPVEIRTVLSRDDAGNPVGMWGIVRDITDRKRSDEKIRLANHKLALMTEVTYQDIQNKVTALRGLAELITHPKSDQEREALIRRAMEILETIHTLIDKTKDYQQMGLDQSRWIDLNETIRQQFSFISGKNSVALDCDLPGLEIYADPLIDHVFYHLMHNAVHHGKTVTRIIFSFQETPDVLILACEDNGIGIPAGQKTHIFERIVGGAGKFGLFFVREFLILSGMTIRETGIPGKSARFEISIPKGLYRFSER
ncbi:MAG TPA: PAS domain S-box protein [Methanoregulaceae archaeon]|nr:PAS domain S-box protein [Methanoregulaceae archaeon]HPD76375.1 PAS domain S-box protein [Methanoregulaceae archaeon]